MLDLYKENDYSKICICDDGEIICRVRRSEGNFGGTMVAIERVELLSQASQYRVWQKAAGLVAEMLDL